MKDKQEFLREQVKRLKWQEDITYREVAEDLLEMNYNSFINWLHRYCDLGSDKIEKLYDYVICMLD